MEIEGKVALVTGAGAGIGEAIALRLAQEGAAVVVNDIDERSGANAVRAIEAAGGRAAFVRADVGRVEDVPAMVAFGGEAFGGLDILVNNAGVVVDPSFPEAAPERWMRVLDVNLRGVMLATQHAVEAMRERGGGVIVNISSGAGFGYGPHPDPEYAASKAGVIKFTATLASLHDELNIRVNCICPGWVDTPMSRRTITAMPAERRATAVPPVLSSPEEIADAVVALIRDDALAGRVMLCFEGQPRELVPLSGEDWAEYDAVADR